MDELKIREWVNDYGICQDFDTNDAVILISDALKELGTTRKAQLVTLPGLENVKKKVLWDGEEKTNHIAVQIIEKTYNAIKQLMSEREG